MAFLQLEKDMFVNEQDWKRICMQASIPCECTKIVIDWARTQADITCASWSLQECMMDDHNDGM